MPSVAISIRSNDDRDGRQVNSTATRMKRAVIADDGHKNGSHSSKSGRLVQRFSNPFILKNEAGFQAVNPKPSTR
jgi:hypothetical protein